MKKRLLAMILTLCLIISLLPTTAFAADTTTGTYEKATSIAVGDTVLFVCEGKKIELSSFNGTSYAKGTSYSSTPAGTMAFQVESGSSAGTFAFKNENNYVAWSSGNSLKTDTSKNANSSWKVSFDDSGNAIILNAANNSRKLQWNASSPRFACYTSSQTAIQLYKLTAACTHNWQEATCTTAKTCTVCKITEGDLLGHNYVSGQCSRCDEKEPEGYQLVTNVSQLTVGTQVIIAAKDYNYALSTNQKDNNRGQAAITKSDDTVIFSEDVQVLTLQAGTKEGTFAFNTGSGYLYAASSSSNYLRTETELSDNSSWKITITNGVATIVSQGSNSRNTMQYNQSSSLFAAYASASQKALVLYYLVSGGETECDHSGNTNADDGNCTTEITCSVCGAVTTPALTHTIESHEAQAPTCTAIGWDAYETCKREGCNYTTYVEKPADENAHAWDEGKITTPATCTAEGVKTYTCTHNSDHTKTESVAIDENAHAWDEGKITTPATCTEKGVKTFTCTHNSGHTKTEPVEIDENAHAWDEGKITTPATCTEKGVKIYTCTHNSDHTKTESVAIDENAHAWDEGKITTPATCTEKGVKTYTCTHNSGHTKTESVAINEDAHAYPATPSGYTYDGKTHTAYYICLNNPENNEHKKYDDTEEHTYVDGQCVCEAVCDHSGNTNADDGDCTTAVKCSVCGTVTTPANNDHTYVDGKCTVCGTRAVVTLTGGEVLYLKPGSGWEGGDARFAVYLYHDTVGSWASLEPVPGSEGYYQLTVPAGSWTNLIFCRMDPANDINDWTNKWNQTRVLNYDGVNNLFTVVDPFLNEASGTWSQWTPPCNHSDTTKLTYTPNSDGTSHKVTCECGETVKENAPHTYENGQCKDCKYPCPHGSYTDGKCAVCKTPCTHANQTTTTVDPTCTDEGFVTVTCDDCGTTISTETTPVLGHTYADSDSSNDGEWVNVTPDTCTGNGQDRRDCGRCDAYETRDVDEIKDHDWKAGEITKQPTCSAEGEQQYVCQHDSSHTKTEPVAINEDAHAYPDTPSGYTKNGDTHTAYYNCIHNAAHTRKTDAPATHTFDATTGQCTVCEYGCPHNGEKRYTDLNNGNHSVICKVCVKIITASEPHGYDSVTGQCICEAACTVLNDFVYTLDATAKTVTLTKYQGQGSAVVVPNSYTVDGGVYAVVLDSETVFRGNTTITSVRLENKVSFVENSMAYLFADCTALTSLDVSGLGTANVTSLRGMFSYCSALTTITGFEKWNTGSVLDMYQTFNRTSALKKIDLSAWDLDQVKNTGWCFQLSGAEEILLPDNLAVISAGFLNHATQVTGSTFTIPAGVKKIGYAHTIYDFATNDFKEFQVAEGNTAYKVIDGILYSMDGTEMLAIPRNKEFTDGVYEIPEGVTFLGELSFSRNYNITKVILPDSLVIRQDILVYDEEYIAFEDKGNLNVGNSLSIAIYCYTSIADYEVKDTNPNYKSVDGILYSKDGTQVVAIPTKYGRLIVIPEGVTTWNKQAMWNDTQVADQNADIVVDNLLSTTGGVSLPASLVSIEEEQLGLINRLKTKFGDAFVITVDAGNPVYCVDAQGMLALKTDFTQAVVVLEKDSFVYDGTEKKPAVQVTLDGQTLIAGADYTVSYENNVNAGTATVTVTGNGRYTGTITKTFTVIASAAKIGNTYYTDLQAALDAAVTGDTVELLSDVEVSGHYLDIYTPNNGATSRNFTLDLNGHTISPAADYKYSDYSLLFIGLNQTVTLKDSSQAKTGTITSAHRVTVGVYGELIMESGTIKCDGTDPDKDAALCIWHWEGGNGYEHEAVGTATVTGGTVTGILVAEGNVSISGGTIDKLDVAMSSTTVTGGTIGEVEAAAKIGNTYYATVAEAVAEAKQDDKVTLLADWTIGEGETFHFPVYVNLDANGYTITNNGTVKLPDTYIYDTIPEKLNGTVTIGEKSYTWNGEKWICDELSHTGGTATCAAKAVCDTCGESYGGLDVDNHVSDVYTYADNGNGTHTKTHECGVAVDAAEDHTGGTATCTTQAKCDLCGASYGEKNRDNHTFTSNKCCGTCGAEGGNLKWTLVDGAFTVTGTGAMKDYDSYSARPWDASAKSITSLTIGEGVTRIGINAFFYCENLTGVTIPASVQELGYAAFTNCFAMTEVTFAEGSQLTTIDAYAFQNCRKLTQITLPAGVGSFWPDTVFSGCSALTDISVAEGNAAYMDIDGVMYSKDGTTLVYYPEGKTAATFTTPAGVTTIGEYAFEGNHNLTAVTLSDGVTSIGEAAFAGCWFLQTVNLPDSLTSIGDCAFLCCFELNNVTIPASVTSIGYHAFEDCPALTTVNVPCNWDTENPLYDFGSSVTVKVGDHHGTPSYTVNAVDSTKHDVTYACCNATVTEAHTFDSTTGKCQFCEHEMAEASASIGTNTTYFETLNGAIIAVSSVTADDHAVVKLLKSIDLGDQEQSISSGVFTLDLNGKTLSSENENSALRISEATVTITDNLGGGEINGKTYGVDAQRSTLTITNAKITATGEYGCGVYAHNCTSVTIEGGTISGVSHGVNAAGGALTITNAKITGTGEFGYGVNVTDCTNVTIEGGTISGVTHGVNAYGTPLTITNAKITVTDEYGYGVQTFDCDEVTIEGCTITATGEYGYGVNAADCTNVTIEGGTISGVSVGVNVYGGTLAIKGTEIIATGEDGSGVQTFDCDEVTIEGGTISSEHDVYCENSTVTLVVGADGTGTTFPGGISVDGITLEAILGEGAACWQDGKMIVLQDGQTEIPGSDVTVKTACKHEGEKSYTANDDGTHSFTCTACGGTVTEAHTLTYSASGNTITESCSDNCGHTGTATVSATGKTYDGTAVEVSVSYSDNWTGDNVTIAYAVKDGAPLNDAPKNAGTYTASITIEGATASVDFTIAKANPTYTAPTVNNGLVYNGAPQQLIETAGTVTGGTVEYSVDNGETWHEVYTNITGTNAGDLKVYYRVIGDSNHNNVEGDNYCILVTIAKATVTVTADATSKTYGENDPTLTYVAEGLVGSDALSGSLSRTAGENVGSYAIDIGTLANNNYVIDFTTANLTITPKTIGVEAHAVSKTYGDADPDLTYTVTGLVGEDQLTGELKRVAGENAGSYDIVQNTLSAGGNYTINYTGAKFTIHAKAITVADVKLNGSLTYNGKEQTQAITVTDGVEYDISGNTATAAGDYTLTVTAKGNYTGQVELSWSIAPCNHESAQDDNDCTTPVVCSNCGTVTLEAYAAHSYTEAIEATRVSGTCTSYGSVETKCERTYCADHQTEPLPKQPDNHTEKLEYTDNGSTHSGAYPCCDTPYVVDQTHEYDATTHICICGAVEKYMATWTDGNGGSYEKEFAFGETITIPTSEFFQETFRKADHTLAGWVGYTEGMTMPAGGVTFTAVYTCNADAFTHKTANAATCVAAGNIEYWSCSCGKWYGDADGKTEIAEADVVLAIDPNAHSWNGGELTTIPTCTAAGVKTYTCQHDGSHTYTEDVAIDPDAHDIRNHDAKTPTCTEIGWDAYVTCSRCDYTTYVEKAALSHDEVNHDAKAPTCTEIGWDAYVTCSRCDYSTYKEKSALDHDEIAHDAKAPTCTEIGWDAYVTCSRCDYTTYVEKAALSHDEVNHDAKAPTCTEIGWDAYVTCSRCDYTTYVEKSALDHAYVGIVTTEPTCTAAGVKTYTCTHDASHTYTEAIPMLDHTYDSNGSCTGCGAWNPELHETVYMRTQLNNSLQVDFAIPMSWMDDWTDSYAVVQQSLADGTTRTAKVPCGNWTKAGEYWLVSYKGVAAKEMMDQMTLVVYNANGEAINIPYKSSLAEYAVRAFNGATTEAAKAMYVEMLYYGAAAQTAFNYRADTLATDVLTDAMKAVQRTTAQLPADSAPTGALNYVGTRLQLENNIQLQTVFNVGYSDVLTAKVICGDVEMEATVSELGNVTTVIVDSLVVADCGKDVTIALYDGKTLVASVTDSAAKWAARTTSQKELAQAMMNFCKSTVAYLDK